MKQRHSLIILLVLTAILATLLTLHIRQWRNSGNATSAGVAEAPAPQVTMPAAEAKLIHVTAENMAEIEARNLATRPAVVPGALDAPVEIKQALQRQTRSLLEENRAEPEAEEDKRSLALSEESILQLEKEGRMAY